MTRKLIPRVNENVETISLTTGDGSSAVTLSYPLKDSNYFVHAVPEEDISATSFHVYITSKSSTGFTINVVSDSGSGSVDIRWAVIPQFIE